MPIDAWLDRVRTTASIDRKSPEEEKAAAKSWALTGDSFICAEGLIRQPFCPFVESIQLVEMVPLEITRGTNMRPC
ncbi:MAG: hypothetical protein NTNFB01_33820 [Nitrospira sp.]